MARRVGAEAGLPAGGAVGRPRARRGRAGSIPVYVHRRMPDRPHAAGNPVFSVHQTNIIYYGADLRDYLLHEFLGDKDLGRWPIPDSVRRIEFWDIRRFFEVRWRRGWAVFDNRKGILP